MMILNTDSLRLFEKLELHTADDQRYGTRLSLETKLKIEELKRLVNKYPQYSRNPDGIIKWASKLLSMSKIFETVKKGLLGLMLPLSHIYQIAYVL